MQVRETLGYLENVPLKFSVPARITYWEESRKLGSNYLFNCSSREMARQSQRDWKEAQHFKYYVDGRFLTIIVAIVRVKHCNNHLKLLNNMKEIQQKEREAYAQMEKIEKDYIWVILKKVGLTVSKL